jgi:hypothetical protein
MIGYRHQIEQSISDRLGLASPALAFADPAAKAVSMTPPEPESYRDKAGIAAHYAMSTRWVEHRMQNGMPHSHVDGRARFRLSEVERWMREGGRLKVSA